MFLVRSAGAGERTSGEVVLTLAGAAKGAADSAVLGCLQSAPGDLELEIVCRDGTWDKPVWAFAPGFNRAQHRGFITALERKGEGARLAVKLDIFSDTKAPGGVAEYRMEVERQGDEFTGIYTGSFIETKVEGSLRGVIRAPPIRSMPAFQPLGPQERPRLIFRAKDLPELKKRMETPEGKLIMTMLDTAPLRHVEQVDDRRSSWLAANWAAIYQLTGDKQAALAARRILSDEVARKPMPIDRADIHLASRLLGVTLAFDLCGDGWEEEFRNAVTEYLYYFMLGLARAANQGLPIEDANPNPWSHANAIRMSAVGLTAIALLGDKGLGGAIHADAEKLLELAEKNVLRYLRLGVGRSGWGAEGDFYKKFALANGLLQFMHAERVALGRDFSQVNPYLLAGYVAAADPVKQNFSGISIRALQASGLYAMGFSSVPAEFLPALKYCFDREAGAAGARHFDCTYPFQAAYILMNYPFGVQAQSPAGAFPWALSDPVCGCYVFRDTWKDSQDFLAIAKVRCAAYPGLKRQYVGKAFELDIWGLGQKWVAAPIGGAERNPFFGGEDISYHNPRPRQAVLSADMERAFLVAGRPPPRPRAKIKGEPPPIQRNDLLWGADVPMTGAGAKGRRHFAADFSGVSGAPGLFVSIDKFQGVVAGRGTAWELGVKDVTFAGPKFASGDADGANLSGLIVAPATSRGGRMGAVNESFVVFTIQNGAPPPIKVEGTGLNAKVTVGGQTVSFDGEKIIFAK